MQGLRLSELILKLNKILESEGDMTTMIGMKNEEGDMILDIIKEVSKEDYNDNIKYCEIR